MTNEMTLDLAGQIASGQLFVSQDLTAPCCICFKIEKETQKAVQLRNTERRGYPVWVPKAAIVTGRVPNCDARPLYWAPWFIHYMQGEKYWKRAALGMAA